MTTRKQTIPGWKDGVYAGLVASVAMGAVAMMLTALAGLGFFAPLRLIASVLLGGAAMTGAGGIVLGLLLHTTTAAAFGLFYALLFGRSNTLATGAVYGLALWVLATVAAVPLMAAPMPPLAFALAHLAYGLALAAWLGR